jgi:hypothetical protein
MNIFTRFCARTTLMLRYELGKVSQPVDDDRSHQAVRPARLVCQMNNLLSIHHIWSERNVRVVFRWGRRPLRLSHGLILWGAWISLQGDFIDNYFHVFALLSVIVGVDVLCDATYDSDSATLLQ